MPCWSGVASKVLGGYFARQFLNGLGVAPSLRAAGTFCFLLGNGSTFNSGSGARSGPELFLCIRAGGTWVSGCRARWFPTGTGGQASVSVCLEHLFMPLPVAASMQYLAEKFRILWSECYTFHTPSHNVGCWAGLWAGPGLRLFPDCCFTGWAQYLPARGAAVTPGTGELWPSLLPLVLPPPGHPLPLVLPPLCPSLTAVVFLKN